MNIQDTEAGSSNIPSQELAIAPTLVPVLEQERYSSLDVIRGVALFGVLMANLLLSFRISEYEHYVRFHTDADIFSRAVDYLREIFISGKAITLFTLLFGVGMAMQVERARASGRRALLFLARRLLVLLCFGFAHYLLLWEGDILVLYASCGLLLLVFIKAGPRLLACVGLALLCISALPSSGETDEAWSEANLREIIKNYTDWYSNGTYSELVGMRWDMLPYSLSVHLVNLPNTAGLTLLGMAIWRSGMVKQPEQWSRGLGRMIFFGGALGVSATAVWVSSKLNVLSVGAYRSLCMLLAHVPLALAYGSAMLLYLGRSPAGKWRGLLAAEGRMALTNYLMQSLIFSFIFYGYGLGLFARVPAAVAAVLGILVYWGQLHLSQRWLEHHRFGPAEWLWRRLTYGSKSMRR